MGFLEGKRVLVCGARNKWSIGWHCALSIMREGGQCAFSVYSDREKGDIEKLLEGAGHSDSPILICDATKQGDVDRLFQEVAAVFGGQLDGLLHSIAYAKREELTGEYAATSQAGFVLAMEASVYTLISLSRGARPMLRSTGGSVAALSYLGGVRAVPGYNVMGVAKAALESSIRYLAADFGAEGIRVNAVSAGPIKTLAASGIAGLNEMLRYVAERAPLKRGVDADEVGDAVAFMLSPLARGITGEVLYVDAGYNIMGM